MSDDDRTKDELQDELRRRDLPVSGTKDELVQRLADAEDSGSDRSRDDRPASQGRSKPKPLQLARAAAQQLQQLHGRPVDGTTGLERTDEGWRVQLEVVESPRIPPSTDVLGTYEVIVDDDGDLVRYERLRRYVRAQAGGDDA